MSVGIILSSECISALITQKNNLRKFRIHLKFLLLSKFIFQQFYSLVQRLENLFSVDWLLRIRSNVARTLIEIISMNYHMHTSTCKNAKGLRTFPHLQQKKNSKTNANNRTCIFQLHTENVKRLL